MKHAVRAMPAQGDALLGHLRGELRCAAVHRHRPQDAAGRVEAGVEARQRRRQHDEVHDVAGGWNPPDAGEERHERAGALLVRGERQQQGQQDQRADVEDGDAEDDGVDGPRHDLGRILGLARRRADQFDCGIGEDDARGDHDQRDEPLGSRPPLSAITDGPVLAPSTLKRPARKTMPTTRKVTSATTLISAAQNSISPNHLTEIMLMVSTITSAMSAISHCGIAPPKVPPVVHVERDGGDVDDRRARPVEEVHPTGDVRGLLAQEFAGVGHERPRRGGAVQHQFAEGSQDEEDEDAADGVDDEHGPGPALASRPAGPHEQARADRATDGDHLDLAGFEPPLLVALFFMCERGIVVCALRFGGHSTKLVADDRGRRGQG